GAHTFDDLLTGVAAFGVADVRVLQARFVGNLLLTEIVTEPRHAQGQAARAHGRVPHRATAILPCGFGKNRPEPQEVLAGDDEFGPGDPARRAFDDAAGHGGDGRVDRRELGEGRDVYGAELANHRGGLRAFEGKRAA